MKLTLTTATLLLSSTAAFAELTPQDVLHSWRSFYAGFGAPILTEDPVVTGNTTRFSDVRAQMVMFDAEAEYRFAWIEMESNADGSIDITFAPEGTATTRSNLDTTSIESLVSYDLSALTIHAEGEPGDIQFRYEAPLITVHQSQSMPEIDVSMTVALENLQGRIHSLDIGASTISDSGTMNIEGLEAKLTFKSPSSEPVYVNYSGDYFASTYDINLSRLPIPSAPEPITFYPDDMVIGLTFSTGAALTTVDQKTSKGDGRFSFAQSGGEFSMAFAENALSQGLSATGARLDLVNTPAQPVDFSAAFDRAHFGLTLPVRKAEAPAPFALAMALEGFTMAPETWAQFDPESLLSQAPASFAFSVNGTMKLFVDLMDQSAIMALRGAPFQLRSLSLSSLSLDFEGMGLTGIGDLTFDNERIDRMSGMPEATGALEFSINGALGLLDKIGRLGFVEPMAIIGAKGALGMFATPNESADSFSSRIEFTEGGSISVNGQQVK